MKQTLIPSLVLLCGLTVHSQGRPELLPPTDLVAPAIAGVVAGGTPIELVKAGFRRTEGPVGMPDGSLLFTEADSIIRIDARGTASSFVERATASNALGFDPQGRLISVQRAQGNEKVGVLYPPGSEFVLADSVEGKPFDRLNDLVVGSGGVYFTDANGICYLPPGGGQVTRVEQGIRNPNGVLLSPDEKTLLPTTRTASTCWRSMLRRTARWRIVVTSRSTRALRDSIYRRTHRGCQQLLWGDRALSPIAVNGRDCD